MQQASGATVSLAPTTVLQTAPAASTQPLSTLPSQTTARITVTPATPNTAQPVSTATHPLSIFNIHPGITIAPSLPLAVAPGTLPSYQQAQMLAAQTPVVTMATSLALAQAQPQPLLEGQRYNGLSITVQIGDKEAVLDSDKKAICRHPLFPLLSLLFDKCEKATQTADCPSAESFGVDIQQFVQQQEREHKPFFNDEPDLDSLMVKAIQVLRIHLLELEKVNELCKDFCSRYITCLKGKLQSENLLRIEGSEFDLSPPSTPTLQTPIPIQQVVTSVGGNSVILQQGIQQPAVSMATLGQGQLVSGGTVYQMVQTPQGIVAQPVQIQTAPIQTAIANSPIIHGSTPLSQIGLVTPTTPSATPTLNSSFLIPTTPTSPCDDDDRLGDKKSKRGVLPKSATHVMRSWLFQHIVHPYPTEDEKRIIANQTNLTLLQVNNWFINARRRILQPMLDSSNPEQNKTKKARPPSRPVQRFWPDKIANLQPQLHPSIDHIHTDPGIDEGAVTTGSIAISESDLVTTTNTHIPQPHQIIIQPGTVITADGQIVNAGTTAVHLAAALQTAPLQSSSLPTIQWQVPVGRPKVENGMEDVQTADITENKDGEES